MTPTDTFRLSTYSALIAACVCLGYSEWDLLPEAAVFAVAVVVVLVGLFFTESRFELSLAAANRAGLGIGVVAVAWLSYQFLDQNSLIYTFPWPASLLPYLGPLLMVLIPAKMVRPKHEGDWWAMQGIGLAGAALASAMAEDAMIGVLLGIYAVCAAWAVTLFFVHRAAGWLEPVPGSIAVAVAHGVGTPRSPGRGALGWALIALTAALPAFFLTPRSQSNRWEFVRPGLETGYSGQDTVDLNSVGDLRASQDVAYQVTVENGASLPAEQRWRGRGYIDYAKGVWKKADSGTHLIVNNARSFGVPADLGPDAVPLLFTRTPGESHSDQILADPVTWRVGEPLPVASVDGRRFGWFQGRDAAVHLHSSQSEGMPYRQLYRPYDAPDRDLGSPFELNAGEAQSVTLAPYVRQRQLPPGIAEWARATLERLARSDVKLASAMADVEAGRPVAPRDFEPVALALARHLANSGEYTYSTRLTRPDKSLDPVVEFLTRTKQGHCQRYAAGLVLALRTLGIPCQYVLGFRGWEVDPTNANRLVIRQEHAHAWAEVLIPRPAPANFEFKQLPPDGQPRVTWHWLSVDATPGGVDLSSANPGSWLDTASDQGRTFFLDFIVGYNPERRQRAVAAAWLWLETAGWKWLVGGTLLALGSLLAPRVRRQFRLAPVRLPRPTTGVAAYDLFRDALAQVEVEPHPGETPREFAGRAERYVTDMAPAFRSLPGAVTDAMQLERYAGLAVNPGETAQLHEQATRLWVALEKVKNRAAGQ